VLKPTIRDNIRVHMLFTLAEARNIALKAEMLMKKMAGSNSKFDPSRRLYNEASKFSTLDKGKAVHTSKQPFMRHDAAKPNKASRMQVDTNKPSKPYSKLMVGKCFKYGEVGYRPSDCRRQKLINMIAWQCEQEPLKNKGKLCKPGRDDKEYLYKYDGYDEG